MVNGRQLVHSPQKCCSGVWVGEVAVSVLVDRALTAHLPLKAHASTLVRLK
jgi:hypothetical protein